MKCCYHINLILLIILLILLGCTNPVVEAEPKNISENDTITITGNARSGNRGLYNFKGNVYVHVGLITDSSVNLNEWRYVKFRWGSTQEEARANKTGTDSWSYTIPGLRKFFRVNDQEKILKIAILFREGNCIDTLCKVLRNEDNSDIFLDVVQR